LRKCSIPGHCVYESLGEGRATQLYGISNLRLSSNDHRNVRLTHDYGCFIDCLVQWCVTDELGEPWNVEYSKSVPVISDLSSRCASIQATRSSKYDPGEPHGSQSIEDGARRWRWTVGYPGQAVVKGIHRKGKVFEPRQRGVRRMSHCEFLFWY
jgi:hypothetical protein